MYQENSSAERINRPNDLAFDARHAVGEFAWQRIEAEGLVELCSRVQLGIPLSLQELTRLEGLSLPILGTLLHARNGKDQVLAATARLRPILSCSFAESLEAGAAASMHVESITSVAPGSSIVIDRWHGRFSFSDLTAYLQEVSEVAGASFRLLGPTARDIKEMLLAANRNPEDDSDVKNFIGILREALAALGIDTIHGGTSLRIHRLCAEVGLKNFIAHDLNNYRLSPQAPQARSFSFHLDTIRRELLEVGAQVIGWLPLFRAVLDRGPSGASASGQPLGLEVLKSVAIARLALPELAFIQAPVAIFGHKAADVALQFGANDLGFVAANSETANRLGLPLLSDIEEVFSTSGVHLAYHEDRA